VSNTCCSIEAEYICAAVENFRIFSKKYEKHSGRAFTIKLSIAVTIQQLLPFYPSQIFAVEVYWSSVVKSGQPCRRILA
jgi:hypothetical protein